ncbi:XRE family transcriptional regulator [Pseudomonas prosekii]|uniref:Phage repressor protein C, contains Cro/C1-type HTH and peptisase s24 domains n=1 Tax=Pseudomonas prosekii TaxID=1148509 RepID=A0A1H1S697_9PSED|nr:S24 family peptidase [Pseudomonas prosekii]SDS43298.1 Phage repressor protein C, contains Cro/C1-type HTH and peptisase s24 domains [Pseudomonas prosekii]
MKTTDRITKLVLARKPEIGVRGFKRDLANTCGVSYEAVRQWFAGDTENIKNENLIAIAEGYDTTVDWLLSGKGEPPPRKEGTPLKAAVEAKSSADIVRQMLAKHGKNLPDDARQKIADAVQETALEVKSGNVIAADFSGIKATAEEILIPQYDIRAAMGHGQVPADYNEAIRNLVVREDVLREKGVTYTSAAALALITGWGQSMEGTINDKDPVVVDRGVSEFIGEGIYVITWHDLLYIKRLQMIDAEHYLLISDNKHYENQQALIEDVRIHAKVLLIWNAKKA